MSDNALEFIFRGAFALTVALAVLVFAVQVYHAW
jgi:hypothetical protein